MQCYYQQAIGHPSRKHCICYQCRECENQFGKDWQHQLRSAIGSYSGELGSGTDKCGRIMSSFSNGMK